MKTTTTADPFPTFKAAAHLLGKALRATVRFFRWMAHRLRRLLFSRNSLKCYLITATLICLTYTSLRWYGRRAWEAEKERAAKAGMAPDFATLRQPMPANEENFLMAPVFGDWTAEPGANGDKFKMWFSKKKYASPPKGINKASAVPGPTVDTLANWCAYFRLTGMLPVIPTHSNPAAELAADQRWKPIIDAVYEASKRSTAVIPSPPAPIDGYRSYLAMDIQLLLKSLMLYARAQLELDNLSEVLPVFRVTDHLFRAGATSESITDFNTIRSEAQLLKTGIILHRWPESLLQELLAANYPELIEQQCQRMYQLAWLYSLTRYQNFPESWANPHSLPHLPRWRLFFLKYIVPDYLITQAMIRSSQYSINFHAAGAPLGPDENWPSRLEILRKATPFDEGPEIVFGKSREQVHGVNIQQDLFYWQYLRLLLSASIRHLAIASELHFHKNKRYPASLEELNQTVPIPTIAMKDVDGQPIRYSTNEAGTWFTLISVGSTPFPKESWRQRYDYRLTFSTAPDSQPK